MTRNITCFVLMAIFLLHSKSYSQTATRVVTGIVTSAEELNPLEGVVISAKGSKAVSGSQSDGIYYISISATDSVLVFSYPNFQTNEVKINSSNEYNVALHRVEKSAVSTAAFHQPVKKIVTFSPIGKWRGSFYVNKDLEIPFLFEVTGTNQQNAKVYLLNAEERFESGKLTLTKDSLFISLDPFENEFAFKVDSQSLAGVLRKQDSKTVIAGVKAERGNLSHFNESNVPATGNISGTYDILFNDGNGKEEKAVGLFTQDGNKLKATFLRVTGDSRYLEGIVEGNNFYLSSFIGGGPSYYKGSFTSDDKLSGQVTGLRGGQSFTGTPNENASLPDPYKLTWLKEGYTSFDFSFPDSRGKKISPTDNNYKNKVVIITITGTWCPNCIDEASFIGPWYKKNKKRGVEAIAIHYERQTDSAYVWKAINRFSKKFDIEYEEVFGGPADKQYVATSLPSLNNFLSFPTIIFLDKKGKVAKIYTGYTGPATGKHYTQFVKEFNDEVDLLLKQ